MSFYVKITGVELKKSILKNIANEINADWNDVAKYVPLVIGSVWKNIFKEHGSRFGHAWHRCGVWTKLLRAKGNRKKYRSLAEVASTPQFPLEDTGMLKMSFQPKNMNSIYGFGKKLVYGGSNLQKARKLNDGGKTDPFRFGEQQEYRLDKNFAKTLPGSKPKTTPTGRKSRAKKNWNPEFFITRAGMRKASKAGRTYNLPARRMEPNPNEFTTAELKAIDMAFNRGIEDVIKRIDR